MTGKLYIDGIDAYTAYGVFVLENGYNDMVAYPPLKKVEFNDWHEEDGIEADLSTPMLSSKEFQMMFGSVSSENIGSMISILSDMSYHIFDFREAGCVRKLRMVSQPNLTTLRDLGKFSLRFSDDFPLINYSYLPPVPVPSVWQRDYEIDGRGLHEYGVWVLEGTDNEIKKMPSVKKNLFVNNSVISGAIYDDYEVTFEPKDVKINCFISTDNLTDLWRNYNALLYDLTRSGEHELYVDSLSEEYPCFYKSASVSRFCPVGKIWLEFAITLTFTSFRVGETEYILASEDGVFIETEDEQYLIAI